MCIIIIFQNKTVLKLLSDKTIPTFLHSLVGYLFNGKMCPIIYNYPVYQTNRVYYGSMLEFKKPFHATDA